MLGTDDGEALGTTDGIELSELDLPLVVTSLE